MLNVGADATVATPKAVCKPQHCERHDNACTDGTVHNGQMRSLCLACGVMMLQGIAGRHVVWNWGGFLQCACQGQRRNNGKQMSQP